MAKKTLYNIAVLVGLLAMAGGCASVPPPAPSEMVFTIDSEVKDVEIQIAIEKDCTGNWNFCKWQ